MGRDVDVLAQLARAQARPYASDFYLIMRSLECAYPHLPRLGTAQRPADEPVRLGQEASLAFSAAPVARFAWLEQVQRWRLDVNMFGLLGPDGPLPLYLTELAQERLSREKPDSTLLDFINMLQHRFIALFYRAWAQTQPAVSFDNKETDRFTHYVSSLMGAGTQELRERDAIDDYAKYYHAGWLIRQVRNPDGLIAVLRSYLKLPVELEQFVGGWLSLPPSERTQLGSHGMAAQLGRGAVLGDSVWDRQHRARLIIGPLTLTAFERFLPGGDLLEKVVAWLRIYSGYELAWEIRLRVEQKIVPELRLGRYGRLGWCTWLGRFGKQFSQDVVFDMDQLLKQNANLGLKSALPQGAI